MPTVSSHPFAPLADSALVTLAAPATFAAAGDVPRMLGRTPAERQVEFAHACGCGEVIAMGADPQAAVALRHLAESLGLKFRESGSPHALGRAGLAGTRLLVLDPRLLPDPAAWPRGGDSDRGVVLTLPAGPGIEAGFERIDLDRAWAGALVIPGALVPRLLALPEDADAASALLRIALQAGVPDHPLDSLALADGRWNLPADAAEARLAEGKWLDRQVDPGPDAPWSARLAGTVLRRAGGRLLERREARPLLLGASGALLAGSLALCRDDRDAAGFAAIALAVPLLELGLGLGLLHQARRGSLAVRDRLAGLRWLVDAALVSCGVIAIEGDRLEQVFAPLVLLAALHAGPRRTGGRWESWRDRALVAVLASLGAVLHSAQAGLMLGVLGLMLLNIAQSRLPGRVSATGG